MSKEINVYEVVKKLIGPIEAVGESNEDGRRLENAKTMTRLLTRLLSDVEKASLDAGRVEASMKTIGEHCSQFLGDIADEFEEHLIGTAD